MENVNKLASDMNVNPEDVLCLAKSVVISIIKDGASDQFLNGSNEDRIKLTEAYIIHAVKKFEKFHTLFITNPEARKAFIESILHIV